MPKLLNILTRAYAYTKNHKFLWFFGFFLTGGGFFNFSRVVEPRRVVVLWLFLWRAIAVHPFYVALVVFSTAVVLLLVFGLVGVCRGALILATLHLERKDPKEGKQPVTFRSVLRLSTKYAWRIALVSFISNAAIVIISAWLYSPILFLFRHGFEIRGVILAVAATIIFVPIIVIISMLNIFAGCFVAVYDLPVGKAFRSSFDLLVRFWSNGIALLFIVFALYCLLFFLSADIISLVGLLAFGLSFLIKSLSIPFALGLVSVLVTAVLVVAIVALLVVNAALNVFSNIAWTLLFLSLVKAIRGTETVEAPMVEPAV